MTFGEEQNKKSTNGITYNRTKYVRWRHCSRCYVQTALHFGTKVDKVSISVQTLRTHFISTSTYRYHSNLNISISAQPPHIDIIPTSTYRYQPNLHISISVQPPRIDIIPTFISISVQPPRIDISPTFTYRYQSYLYVSVSF
jgi:hypothetical protein